MCARDCVCVGLPVYENGRYLRDVVKKELKKLTQQQGADPAELVPSSALVAASGDWAFPGGTTLLLELLALGFACSDSDKDDRPVLAVVVQTLQTSVAKMHAALTRECLLCLDAPRTQCVCVYVCWRGGATRVAVCGVRACA